MRKGPWRIIPREKKIGRMKRQSKRRLTCFFKFYSVVVLVLMNSSREEMTGTFESKVYCNEPREGCFSLGADQTESNEKRLVVCDK